MLKIALCHDESEQRQLTQKLVSDYAAARGLPIKVRVFASGWELLGAIDGEDAFDLYILDIVMPEMSGIELGLQLRKTDRDGAIIYLTTSPDFAIESYETRAFHYLLKPVVPKKRFSILDEAVETLNKHREDGIQIKTQGGMTRLSYDGILYAELKNRAVRYYLQDGSFADSTTLSSSFREAVSSLLEDKRFLLCGASFMVNLCHIKMVDKAGATLSDGRALSLPKTACTTLRAAWSDYWLEGGQHR